MKAFILFLSIIFTIFPLSTYSASKSITPERLIITGSVVAGIELIYALVNYFSQSEEETPEKQLLTETSTNSPINPQFYEELDKYELLMKLTKRSKLFDVLNIKPEKEKEKKDLNLILADVKEKKPKLIPKGLFTDEEIDLISTNKIIVQNIEPLTNFLYSETNINITNEFKISKEEEKKFYYTTTNSNIIGSKSSEKKINYYELGKMYYIKGEYVKAREFFLKTLISDVNRKSKAKALVFLETVYKMSLEDVVNETRRLKSQLKK